MGMTFHAAVWLDHEHAKVFHFNRDSWEESVLKMPKHQLSSRAKIRDTHHRGETHDQKEYFEAIAKAVDDAAEILVLGPGTAKLQFIKHVHENDARLEKRIVGVEGADHPTDRQIIEHARKYFVVKDRFLGTS
jgi:stalled ribosome rescue protein Dom34